VSLGVALGKKGDWDGEIREEREAIRLDPNNPFAHNDLGVALEKKGDLQGALAEYEAALTLDPQNVAHQENYEHLVQQMKK
jgi:superkiller protein 3